MVMVKIDMPTDIDPPKLIRLKQVTDDAHHKRRAEKHGYIYFATRFFGNGSLVEAKSVATGALCTLDRRFIEELADGEEAP